MSRIKSDTVQRETPVCARDVRVCKSRVQHLTKREVDVLVLIASDLANTEIATSLVIDVRTIEAHVSNNELNTFRRARVI